MYINKRRFLHQSSTPSCFERINANPQLYFWAAALSVLLLTSCSLQILSILSHAFHTTMMHGETIERTRVYPRCYQNQLSEISARSLHGSRNLRDPNSLCNTGGFHGTSALRTRTRRTRPGCSLMDQVVDIFFPF